jgi:hypothetical protein
MPDVRGACRGGGDPAHRDRGASSQDLLEERHRGFDLVALASAGPEPVSWRSEVKGCR